MYTAEEIAKFVITFCNSIGRPISNLHLQKILYYLQVHFAKRGQQLFIDELYAWQYGPVVPNVYFLFSGYGATKIRNSYVTNIQSDIAREIENIVRRLIDISPCELVNMTHKENGPWSITYDNGAGKDKVIDYELLSSDTMGE